MININERWQTYWWTENVCTRSLYLPRWAKCVDQVEEATLTRKGSREGSAVAGFFLFHIYGLWVILGYFRLGLMSAPLEIGENLLWKYEETRHFGFFLWSQESLYHSFSFLMTYDIILDFHPLTFSLSNNTIV